MKELSLLKIFKALSDPTRLQIVLFLAKLGEQPCAQMLDEFKLSQPTMSHHFSKLIKAGLILKEKKGVSNFYKINKEFLKKSGFNLDSLYK